MFLLFRTVSCLCTHRYAVRCLSSWYPRRAFTGPFSSPSSWTGFSTVAPAGDREQNFFPLSNNKLCSCVFLFIQMRHFPISVLPSIFRDQFLSFSCKDVFPFKKEKRKPCNNIIALWVMILNSL